MVYYENKEGNLEEISLPLMSWFRKFLKKNKKLLEELSK